MCTATRPPPASPAGNGPAPRLPEAPGERAYSSFEIDPVVLDEAIRLDDALRILSQKGKGAFVMAGGTDLVMKMNQGLVKPAAIISLTRIKGLNNIEFDPRKGLTIGATALIAEVASHPEIKKRERFLPFSLFILIAGRF